MPSSDTKKLSVREARSILKLGSEDEREAVKQELMSIAASNVTDILSWDTAGNVSVKASKDLPLHVQKSIKKIKVIPGEYGNQVELEMHDKLAALRVMARYHGLTEPNQDTDKRPSILGINLRGPEVTDYQVLDEPDSEPDTDKDDADA